MMLPCKVIEDILPMYYDKVCSEESAVLVEEHLKACTHCNRILSELCSEIVAPEKNVDDIKALKKIQKSYKRMKTHWLIVIVVILLFIPVAFLIGAEQGEQREPSVEFTKEEATAYANDFMTCLMEKDYAQAYTYWDIEREKKDLLNGNLFVQEDLANFEADGLKKFCEGGEKLNTMGGIESFEFVQISDPGYFNLYGTEDYIVSYTVKFNGRDERIGVSLTENGIDSISSGDGLIKHPLSHLTLWVQWVVDDYMGRHYDFELGEWVNLDKAN